MIHLDAQQTRACLPMADAIEAMEHAFSSDTEMPPRSLVGKSLIMPGRVGEVMAVKVVSTSPGNPSGLVAVFGPDGVPLGIVDGPTLTAIRTGAVCGLVTRLVAAKTASCLAMLGAGAMAFDQIEAIRAVRPIRRILVWSRSKDRAADFAARVGGESVVDPDEAVGQADVISCATPSHSPLFDDSSVRPGSHVNAVGAFTPAMVELPPGLVRRSYVVVDDFDAAAAEAGDLIQAGSEPSTTLFHLLAGNHPSIDAEVTIFKSVGIAIQDVAAAQRALENAAIAGIGTVL